jgi:hypothetical protein
MSLSFTVFLSAAAAAAHKPEHSKRAEPLCSSPASDISPERTVGGVACCKEVYPGFQFPPWEKDYLHELVGASPDGNCVCEGNPANPIKVRAPLARVTWRLLWHRLVTTISLSQMADVYLFICLASRDTPNPAGFLGAAGSLVSG